MSKRKTYRNLTGGLLSLSRSKLTQNGNRVGLPSIEFDRSIPLVTGSEEVQSYLENHSMYGKWFELVEPAVTEAEPSNPDEPLKPDEPEPAETQEQPEEIEPTEEPASETVEVEVKTINEVRDYLNDRGIDISGLRSWDAFIAEGAKHGITFVRT